MHVIELVSELALLHRQYRQQGKVTLNEAAIESTQQCFTSKQHLQASFGSTPTSLLAHYCYFASASPGRHPVCCGMHVANMEQ